MAGSRHEEDKKLVQKIHSKSASSSAGIHQLTIDEVNSAFRSPTFARTWFEVTGSPMPASVRVSMSERLLRGKTQVKEDVPAPASAPGQDGDQGLAFLKAVAAGRYDVVLHLLGGRDTRRLLTTTDEQSRTCMHLAAREGHVELVNILSDKGADTEARDRFGKTPLHWACQLGRRRAVEALLDCGARADAEDRRGCTALHLAACSEDATICRVLLERQRRLLGRRDCHGRGPLFYAVLNAHPDAQQRATQLLLEQQAEVTEQDDYGREPLHYAAEEGRRPAVQALLKRKADPQAGDKVSGITPLQLASNEPVLRDLHAALGTGPSHHPVPAGPAWAAVVAGGCGSGVARSSGSPSPAAGRRPTAPVGPADRAAGLGPGRPLRWAEPPTQEALGAPFQVLQARFVKIMERVQQGGLDQMEHIKRPHLFTGSWMSDVSTHQQLLGQTFKYIPGPEVCMRVFNLLRPPESFPPTRGDEKDILRHYGEELDAAKPWDGADPYNTAVVMDEDDVTAARKVELIRKIQDQRQQLEAQEGVVEELRRRCEQLKVELHDPESTRALRAQVHEAHRQLTVQGDELQEVQGQAKMLEATAIGLKEQLQEEKGRSAELLAQQVKVRTQLEVAQKRIGWERSLEIALEQEKEKVQGAQEYFQQCLRDAEAIKNGAVDALQLEVSELQEQLRAATERGQHALFAETELEQLRNEVTRLKQEKFEADDRSKKEKAEAVDLRKRYSQLELDRVEEQRAHQAKVDDLQREMLSFKKSADRWEAEAKRWEATAKRTAPVLEQLFPPTHDQTRDRSAETPAEQDVGAEFKGEVHVAIVSATGLRNADKVFGVGGKSDPYCTCKPILAAKKAKALKSDTIQDSLDPVWNFTGQVAGVSAKGDALLFEVFDHDSTSGADKLGRAEVKLEDGWLRGGHAEEMELTLLDAGNGKTAKLNVMVVVVPAALSQDEKTKLMSILQTVGAAFKGQVHVAIVRATGLRAADPKVLGFGGKSDPYCTCRRRKAPAKGNPALKTKTIPKTLDPEWDFPPTVVEDIAAKDDALLFEVFDEDKINTDDKLGKVEVPLKDDWLLKGYSEEMKLPLQEAGKDIKAELTVKIVVIPAGAPEDLQEKLLGKLCDACVVSIHAEGLRAADWSLIGNAKSDPYVKCKIRDANDVLFKTQVVNKELNPKWEERYPLPSRARGCWLEFEVMDWDRVSDHDLLGTASILLSADPCPVGKRDGPHELPLGNHRKASGFLTVLLEGVKAADVPRVPCITICRAEGLRSADWDTGKSDPFCKCRIQGVPDSEFKTTVKTKDMNPVWDFRRAYPGILGCTLEFEVFDHDKLKSGEKLGETTLMVAEHVASGEEAKVPEEIVLPLGGDKKAGGKLVVRMEGVRTKPESRASLTIMSATDLRKADRMGLSDPWCKCDISLPNGKKLEFQTPIIKQNLNPQWNWCRSLPSEALGQTLAIEVRDWDQVGSGDTLGKVTLKLSEEPCKNDEKFDRTLKLGEHKKAQGSLMLRLQGIKPADAQGASTPSGAEEVPTGAEAAASGSSEVAREPQQEFALPSVVIVSAEGLRAADVSILSTATSDPYCECRVLDGQSLELKKDPGIKTKVISKTLQPKWDEKFALEGDVVGCILEFEVWDHDMWPKKPDFLGKARLKLTKDRLPHEETVERTLTLESDKKGIKAQGTLTVRLGGVRPGEQAKLSDGAAG